MIKSFIKAVKYFLGIPAKREVKTHRCSVRTNRSIRFTSIIKVVCIDS